MLVLKALVGLHRTFNFSLFSLKEEHPGSVGAQYATVWGIGLDYHDIALEMNRVILSLLRLYPSTAFQTLLLTMMATPFLLRDSCPQ